MDAQDLQIGQGAPKVDFSPLSTLFGDYVGGQKLRKESDTINAFKGGVPLDESGHPDFNAMAKVYYKLGDPQTATSLENIGIQRDQLTAAQKGAADLAGIGQAGPVGVQPVGAGGARADRNNNPGNLEATPWTQKQPGYAGTDGRFAQFQSPQMGADAADRLLITYGNQGKNTIASIVNSWAPASENPNTPQRVLQIARQLNIAPDAQLNLNDPAIRQKLAPAIFAGEGGSFQPQGQQQQPNGAPGAAPQPQPVTTPQPDRGSDPTGLDPEAAKQRQMLVYYSSNPAFGKAMNDSAKAQLESFDKQHFPERDPNAQEYDQARRQGYAGSRQEFQADKASTQARSTKIGDAEGNYIGDFIERGRGANLRLQNLSAIEDALKRGGGDMTTGPAANFMLKARQGLSSMFGIDIAGVPEAEMAQHIGFGFATQASKEISSRPAQMEFLKGLENNPNLLMSQKGSLALISILKQSAQQDAELSRMAMNKGNQKEWGDVVDRYYRNNPIISPFTGKPLGYADGKYIADQAKNDPGAQQQQGAAPKEGATIVNPKTGERRILQGGKWLPAT